MRTERAARVDGRIRGIVGWSGDVILSGDLIVNRRRLNDCGEVRRQALDGKQPLWDRAVHPVVAVDDAWPWRIEVNVKALKLLYSNVHCDRNHGNYLSIRRHYLRITFATFVKLHCCPLCNYTRVAQIYQYSPANTGALDPDRISIVTSHSFGRHSTDSHEKLDRLQFACSTPLAFDGAQTQTAPTASADLNDPPPFASHNFPSLYFPPTQAADTYTSLVTDCAPESLPAFAPAPPFQEAS